MLHRVFEPNRIRQMGERRLETPWKMTESAPTPPPVPGRRRAAAGGECSGEDQSRSLIDNALTLGRRRDPS